MSQPLVVFSFPMDGHFWRVDWFGRVDYPDRSSRHTQPSIAIHISRIRDPSILDDPDALLVSDSTIPVSRKSCWLPVGAMRLISVGSIWKNGLQTHDPEYEQEQFNALPVVERTTAFVKAGLNPAGEGFLLPLSEHPWHQPSTQSYCLQVMLDERRRLLIPCLELIRFYFGSSSGLLSTLFKPGAEKTDFFTRMSFDQLTRRLEIDLAEGMSGVSAPDIGRLAVNEHAWRVVQSISRSLLERDQLASPVYVKAGFPYKGKTDLVVRGKWLSYAGEPKTTFIVYSVVSCSYPFPFRSLKYTAAWKKRTNPAHGSGGSQAEGIMARTTSSSNPGLVNREASKHLKRTQRFIDQKVRFPDLKRKSVWKEQEFDSMTQPERIVSQPAIDDEAVGESNSGSKVRGVDLLASGWFSDGKQPPKYLKPVIRRLKMLGKDAQIKLLTSSGEDGWTLPVNVDLVELFMRDAVRLQRLQVGTGHNRRPRRVCVFEIKRQERCFKLLALESRPTFVYCCDAFWSMSEILLLAVERYLSRRRWYVQQMILHE